MRGEAIRGEVIRGRCRGRIVHTSTRKRRQICIYNLFPHRPLGTSDQTNRARTIYPYHHCDFQVLSTSTMCDDAEVLARGCGHLYDLDIRRCPNAIQNGTTCPPHQRTRVRYPQEDHDGKCKACQGQSPPDSTWCVHVRSSSLEEAYTVSQICKTVLDLIDKRAGAWVVRFSW